jgi:hypothetical protein
MEAENSAKINDLQLFIQELEDLATKVVEAYLTVISYQLSVISYQ